jgi:hypothetical protein
MLREPGTYLPHIHLHEKKVTMAVDLNELSLTKKSKNQTEPRTQSGGDELPSWASYGHQAENSTQSLARRTCV